MKFKTAIKSTPCLSNAYREGLGAIKQSDRSYLKIKSSRNISGSIDLDAALQIACPDEPRWDYGIGYRSSGEKVFWVEIHPASSHHIDEMLTKLAWLKNFLRLQARLLADLPPEFVWIASGSVALQPGSPQRKRLARHGLTFAGKLMSIGY